MNSKRRWQYKIEEVKPGLVRRPQPEEIQDRLDSLGSKGWELVNVNHPTRLDSVLLYLKKPM